MYPPMHSPRSLLTLIGRFRLVLERSPQLSSVRRNGQFDPPSVASAALSQRSAWWRCRATMMALRLPSRPRVPALPFPSSRHAHSGDGHGNPRRSAIESLALDCLDGANAAEHATGVRNLHPDSMADAEDADTLARARAGGCMTDVGAGMSNNSCHSLPTPQATALGGPVCGLRAPTRMLAGVASPARPQLRGRRIE